MRVFFNLLVCLALLSVANTKKPKPVKPSKPGKPGKPSKPGKPGPEKPPTTMVPPKPVEPEVESINEMFDQKAFEAMPGCLPCLKKDAMYDCITTCYDSSKDYAPEKCLVCLLEKQPMCVAPCGFTNMAAVGAFPAPPVYGKTDCIQQGQGIMMTDGVKLEENNSVVMIIPGVHSAYECGVKCLHSGTATATARGYEYGDQATASTRWTYYNQYAARSEDRYNCYCLNEESNLAPIMPRLDMDSGFEGCPVAPTVRAQGPY